MDVHPDKGAREAIEVARRTGHTLILAGIVQDAEYFRTAVEPFLDGDQIRYLGSVGPTQRDALLGGASALLHLIQFDEPFGLSVIEAMATGTPVIAFRRGSMPELIENGRTGFLVDAGSIENATEAISRIGDLDRHAARQHVEQHFSADRMVDDYLRLYLRLLGRPLEPEAVGVRRPPPPGARCDACHARKSRVQRSRDGLLTICRGCARGAELTGSDSGEAIEAIVSRAPAAERRSLTRRLVARQTTHAARRERQLSVYSVDASASSLVNVGRKR